MGSKPYTSSLPFLIIWAGVSETGNRKSKIIVTLDIKVKLTLII
jgi:hypothetical protein